MDAALYLLLNSALLVGAMALIFSLLGFWAGWLVWGKKAPDEYEYDSEEARARAENWFHEVEARSEAAERALEAYEAQPEAPVESSAPVPVEEIPEHNAQADQEERVADDSSFATAQQPQSDTDTSKVYSDDTLGLLYKEPPDAVDDLTVIKGIGAVLNGKLKGMGIYTYRQIADWDPAKIESSTNIPFKDRILRDDWISQSQKLHREKYGELF